MNFVGNLQEEVEKVKKKFALAALLLAALMLAPSFAMAKEQTKTKRYRLPVNVSVNDSEGGEDYTIWLTCEIHDMYEDGDLSQFLTVKSATQDDESLDIYLETETMNW